MALNKLNLCIAESDEMSLILIPKGLYNEELKLVSFGNTRIECDFQETTLSTCMISKDIWEALNIPESQRWHIYIDGDTLHVLPVIGIFTTDYNGSEALPFGKRTEEFKQLATMTKAKGGCAYFFTTEQIDWENGTVNALVFDDDTGWKKMVFTFPHVVYDRTPNRRTERLEKVKHIKSRFQTDYGIPWFNPNFFNKWDLYNLLKTHPLANQYLPKSFSLSLKSLKKALTHFNMVYIKPKNSSLGNGIRKVSREENGSYSCQTDTLEHSSTHYYDSIKQLIDQEFEGKSLEKFMLQQGIHLQTNEERPYDFRIHTNKDGNGKWQISAIAVKVAGEYKLTTHNFRGGKIKALNDIFDKETATTYLRKFKEDVIALSEALDEKIDGLIGELGFDLGVDKDGRTWLFEVNSRPGKIIFHQPSIRKQEKLVNHYWFEYCLYLAKLSIEKPLTFMTI